MTCAQIIIRSDLDIHLEKDHNPANEEENVANNAITKEEEEESDHGDRLEATTVSEEEPQPLKVNQFTDRRVCHHAKIMNPLQKKSDRI